MIKGPEDPTYRRLWQRYERLVPSNGGRREWILEGPEASGTAFMLKGTGLVTCFHVVAAKGVDAFRPLAPSARFQVVVKHALKEIDLAVCDLAPAPKCHSLHASSNPLSVGAKVRILGYPDWNRGNSIFDATGEIVLVRRYFGAPYALVSVSTGAGNSGGPVLDESGRVIGVVRTGERWHGDEEGKEHGILGITALEIVSGAGADGSRML